MKCDIAICLQCGSPNISAQTERVDDAPAYRFVCHGCGHTTPARASLQEAAGDVDWIKAQDARIRS